MYMYYTVFYKTIYVVLNFKFDGIAAPFENVYPFDT